MVAFPLLAGAASAAIVSTLTPGPAFLSALGIGATQGRGEAGLFILGSLAGDVLWSGLAMAAIVGSAVLGPMVFEVLGLVCAGYLFWIGCKAVAVRRGGAVHGLAVRRPVLRGIALGLTNPKGYPVAVALFTAFLAGKGRLTWEMLPLLEGAAIMGFLLADGVVIFLVGLPWVRRAFNRHSVMVTRICGLVFIGFAIEVALDSATGFLQRRERTAVSG